MATCRIKTVLIIWRLHPQCTNSSTTRDPRVGPRPGPRLYDDLPNAASSTHAVASAQNPASEMARTVPRPPGGPPPEEADGANYILPPGTSPLLSRAEAMPGTPTAPQQRAPRRALVPRPEGAGIPRAPLGTNAPILSRRSTPKTRRAHLTTTPTTPGRPGGDMAGVVGLSEVTAAPKRHTRPAQRYRLPRHPLQVTHRPHRTSHGRGGKTGRAKRRHSSL